MNNRGRGFDDPYKNANYLKEIKGRFPEFENSDDKSIIARLDKNACKHQLLSLFEMAKKLVPIETIERYEEIMYNPSEELVHTLSWIEARLFANILFENRKNEVIKSNYSRIIPLYELLTQRDKDAPRSLERSKGSFAKDTWLSNRHKIPYESAY